MKKILSEQESKNIIKTLDKLLRPNKLLSFEKKIKLFCYYIYKKKQKKLLFYINPRTNEVIFWIGHWWTSITTDFPILKIVADESKKSVIKFSIKSNSDIQKKAIKKIITMILESKLKE